MTSEPVKTSRGLSVQTWIAVIVALLSVLIIFVNWDQTVISFLFFKVTMPLAIALALAFFGGAATGALVMHRRASRARTGASA